MSRFSKAEIEARGWQIVHTREERKVPTNDAGEYRIIPGSYRAEKSYNDGLINEEAETLGLLLERVTAKENQLEAAGVKQIAAPLPEDRPLDEAGIEQRTVIITTEPQDLSFSNEGIEKISDAELSSRTKSDAIVARNEDGEPEMQFHRPTDAAIESQDVKSAAEAEVENARTAEPDYGDAEQVYIPNSQAPDSPGQSGPSQIVKRVDEEPHEIGARKQSEAVDAESERVQRQTEIGFHPAPEGQEKLAGVGASIKGRAALGSEVPKQGETHDAAEAIVNPPDPPEEEEVSPTEEGIEARQDAQEEAAQDAAAEHGKEADKPEIAQEAVAAGAEAEQDVKDQAEQDSDAPESEESEEQ